MTRRTRKSEQKLEITAWVMEIQSHETIYGLMSLPAGSDVGSFAEGLTIELDCTTHEPFDRMGEPRHVRIVADRIIGQMLDAEEEGPYLGVGGIIRNDGRNEFLLTLPKDVVLDMAQMIESGALKHIEIHTADFGAQTVALSVDFSRGRRSPTEREAAKSKLRNMVGPAAGEA